MTDVYSCYAEHWILGRKEALTEMEATDHSIRACPPHTVIWHVALQQWPQQQPRLPPELLALQLHQHARLTDHQSVYLASDATFLLYQLPTCQHLEGPVR